MEACHHHRCRDVVGVETLINGWSDASATCDVTGVVGVQRKDIEFSAVPTETLP
ncbi:uncharacterized protein DS421_6g194900 [Arachis hypogaea]|nr:uncharacterized protein DS421_6g194900 [Arachis hypogaea]